MNFNNVIYNILKSSPILLKKEIRNYNEDILRDLLIKCLGYNGIVPKEFLKENPDKELKWVISKIFKNIAFYYDKPSSEKKLFEILNKLNFSEIKTELEFLDFFNMLVLDKDSEVYLSIYHNLFIFIKILLFVDASILFFTDRKDEISPKSKHYSMISREILSLIFYIINIDGKIHKQERKIFSQLVSIVDKKFIIPEEIDFNSTIEKIKKLNNRNLLFITYKISLITTLLDNKMHTNEALLLDELRKAWNISEKDHSKILIDISNDVKINKNIIYRTNISKIFKLIEKNIVKKITGIVLDNKDNIILELSNTKEMAELINKKVRGGKLTPKEDQMILTQLASVLKTVPALGIFMLPGGAVLLPVLSKILPFSILPDAFEQERQKLLSSDEKEIQDELLLCIDK